MKESVRIIECNGQNVSIEKVDEECQIYLNCQIVATLINNGCFQSTEFIGILNDISHLCLEIKYPSESFDNTMSEVVNLRKSGQLTNNFLISVFITGIRVTDYKLENHTDINIAILDNTVEILEGISCCATFCGCSSLTQVTIPSSVRGFGGSVFRGCSSLTEITIPSSIDDLGCRSFEGCTSLKNITIPSSIKTISSEAFKGCTSLTHISIPSISRIDKGTFDGCSNLKEITIPSSVKQIDKNAFKGCSSITQITIPSLVTKICESTFEDCTSLKEIIIPPTVDEIKNVLLKDVHH